MDWEMHARQLANQVRMLATCLVAVAAWLWFKVDGWATIAHVWAIACAFAAWPDARIKP